MSRFTDPILSPMSLTAGFPQSFLLQTREHCSSLPASLVVRFLLGETWLSLPSGPESPHPRRGLCVCCVGLVDEWRGPPGSGPNSTAGQCFQVKKKGRQRQWKPRLPGRGGLFPGPSAHPWVPHGGPCGFRKKEAQADVDAQLCGPPATSRLPDGLRALEPWKKPGRPLPARLGRAALHSFLMRHGGPLRTWLFQASVEPHGRAKLLQVVQPTSHT